MSVPQIRSIDVDWNGFNVSDSIAFAHADLGKAATVDRLILAQQFEETDFGAQIQDAWSNFVESGQIWALIIGWTLGYMFRTFTS